MGWYGLPATTGCAPLAVDDGGEDAPPPGMGPSGVG